MTALFATVAVCMYGMGLLNQGTVLPDKELTQSADMDNVDLAATMPATNTAGKWLLSYEDAVALATVRNVPLIVHFEASWCGPCRQMESTVLTQSTVLEQLSGHFVGVRVDADQHPDLVSRFRVASLPTEVVLGVAGDELARYVGITSLDAYLGRLNGLSGQQTSSRSSSAIAQVDADEDDKTRSCLIVRRDGKMVGMGGFSPVALISGRVWDKGKEEFFGSFENVDYFFRSAEERDLFLQSPESYLPRLHGCDPVSLYMKNRAEAGAIEFGAFYKGQLYFFASLQNRQAFQRNPTWYASGMLRDYVDNADKFPFIQSTILE